MPLKPEGNIDQEARIPDGFEFRQDPIWSKIEEKQNPRKKKPVFWWVAAASVILAIGYSIYPVQDIKLMNETRVSEILVPQPEPVEKEILNVEEPEAVAIVSKEVAQKANRKAEVNVAIASDSAPEMNLELPESQKVDLPLIAISPVKEQVTEPTEPELSPAAQRLQKSLQKLDPNKAADETLIAEKFNLLQELRLYPVQAATNQKSSSVYSSLIKRKHEKN